MRARFRRARDIYPGDILLSVPKKPGFISRLIRRRTDSAFSHAALVTSVGERKTDFKIIEVSRRIEERSIHDFPDRQWILYRPRIDGRLAHPSKGRKVARDTIKYLEAAGTLGSIYPYHKLLAYILPFGIQKEILRGGAKQVCSVITIRAWISHGLEFYVWNGDNRELIDNAEEVRTVTPGNISRFALEGGGDVIAWTPNAPALP